MQRARLWCIHSAFPCPSCKEWSLQRFCLISCALQRSYMTYSSISGGKLLLWNHILKPWTPSELKSSSCLNIYCLYSLWAPWVFPGRWAVPWKWGFRQSPKTHCYQSYTATPIAILSYYFAYQRWQQLGSFPEMRFPRHFTRKRDSNQEGPINLKKTVHGNSHWITGSLEHPKLQKHQGQLRFPHIFLRTFGTHQERAPAQIEDQQQNCQEDRGLNQIEKDQLPLPLIVSSNHYTLFLGHNGCSLRGMTEPYGFPVLRLWANCVFCSMLGRLFFCRLRRNIIHVGHELDIWGSCSQLGFQGSSKI